MAVRIYSLAKELKVDSKELVDICTQIGISGKGSALASLDDGEVTKIREHLSGGGAKPSAGPGKKSSAPIAPQRPTKKEVDRVKVISTPKPIDPVIAARQAALEQAAKEKAEQEAAAAAAAEAAEASRASEDSASGKDSGAGGDGEPAESDSATAATPAEPPQDEGPRRPGPLARVMQRGDYVPPGGTTAGGKPPVLGGGGARKAGKGSGGRARPAIKLAPMPTNEPPKPAPRGKKEPAAQKPDMKLPADALKASKAGATPLKAHLRKAEDALQSEKEKGAKGRGKKGDTPMLGGREQRQLSRSRTGRRSGGMSRPPRRSRRRRSGINTAAPRKGKVTVQLPCTVRELSEAAGVAATDILRLLMEEGVMTTIAAVMDPDLTELVAAELGLEVEFRDELTVEDEYLAEIRDREDAEEDLQPRAPIITFLGHVDHGKTSLIDKIIDTDVVSGESGGITQHIRAYTIFKNDQQISFVDTPGHEAFTEMRARGANVTDIAVLVVAADDGIMPQTEEAISHARAAEVPIIVALNKCDLPGVDANQAMQGLTAQELVPSEWGGDVEVVKTSAITGEGIDELLDTILTVAELHEFTANPDRPALGTCIEAQQESDRGVVSKVMVQNGTLRVGDVIVSGQAYGKVKAMYDTLIPTARLEEAGPSVPVNITGFDVAPGAGEAFYVLDDIAKARTIAEDRAHEARNSNLDVDVQHVTLENLFDRLDGAEEVQTLNIILRADVRGSIEAIQKELGKLDHPEVKIKLLQKSVGGITEADVTLADASDAIIIGFNVVPDEKARIMADKRGVQVRRYEVIYKITEDLKAAIEGLLKPEEREIDLGRALVQQIFKISRSGTIAGCRVLSGVVERNARARVIRDNTIIGDYPIDTLRREKDDAKEVREGLECGIKLSGFNDVKEGDLFDVYRVEEVGRSFED
ncbi:translation initiation factor IF-2 [Adhaeretor mobilis]|uniref:Translation initiation factor IF-2 n=1 Tax=Adhaeretor mobilis TaxID=1930276 RepID=A0A517MZZ0_9BACT|nr:translation initiation factor IF-2 [Adhaeretor mobilis]QDT00462.1 Translation initiation factor IF-2 [Adhaeretor mobilis]